MAEVYIFAKIYIKCYNINRFTRSNRKNSSLSQEDKHQQGGNGMKKEVISLLKIAAFMGLLAFVAILLIDIFLASMNYMDAVKDAGKYVIVVEITGTICTFMCAMMKE